MRDAAAILDADTKRNGDDVDIRKVRADDQRRSCKRRSAFETALRERQADERVGEVVHPLRAEIGNGKWNWKLHPKLVNDGVMREIIHGQADTREKAIQAAKAALVRSMSL